MTNEKTTGPVPQHVRDAFKANSETLARIIATGEVAVLVVNPNKVAAVAARSFGWDGESPAFQMASGKRQQMIRSCDVVTRRWLSGGRRGRVLCVADAGTLLVNVDPDAGMSLEPGSTDSEYLS